MTAIIGRTFSNGVLFTGDKRTSHINNSSKEVESFKDNLKKVITLNKKMLITFAGIVNIINKNGYID